MRFDPRRARAAVIILVLAALGVYFAVLLKNNCFFAGGPDSSGYLNGAKLIASGRMSYPMYLHDALELPIQMPYVMTPLGFARGQVQGFMVPTYPAGVSFHQALLAKIGGWERAPYLLSPIAAVLCFFVTFAIARIMKLGEAYSAASGAVVILIPVLISHAVQPVSDVVATFYALLTMWLALRARERLWWAALAGVAFSIGVWIRPTNFLLVIPLMVALRMRFSRLVVAGAASLPLGLALAWWNKTLYGGPTRTGYGSLREVIDRTPICGEFHISTLGVMLTPLVVAGSVFVLVNRRVEGWHRALLAAWVVPLLIFYSYYNVCDEWVSARFVLPVMPAVVIGFMLVLQRSAELVGRTAGERFARVVAVVMIACIFVLQVKENRILDVFNHKKIDSIFVKAITWADPLIPPDAVVLSSLMSGPYIFYRDRMTIRWEEAVIANRLPVLREAAKRKHLKWYALVSDVETRPEHFEAWKPAKWVPVGSVRDVTLWRLEE